MNGPTYYWNPHSGDFVGDGNPEFVNGMWQFENNADFVIDYHL